MIFSGMNHEPSNDPIALIKEFGQQLQLGAVIDPFLDFIETSPIICDVMAYHSISRTDLIEFYSRMRRSGAGQEIDGHYVPCASLANPLAIDFICTILHRNDGWDNHNKWLFICDRLVLYVSTGDSVPLDTSFFSKDD